MSNLYQFLEKTKKNNLFLEDNEILKKKLFLLEIEEIQLFKRDKEVFKHFYGENNFNALSKVIKNKTSDEFTNFFEVRTGKLKYLIDKIENKLKQEKNSNKIFILENELKKLRKKENRLYVINNRKIKNAYLLNEEDEKKEQKESLFNRGLKKFENLTTDLISFGAKSNKAEDSALIKATRIILKVLAMAYGLYVTASLVTAFPVLIVPVAVALGTCLVYLVAVGTAKAIKFLKKIAESNKEIISKFLGITLEDINKYLDDAEGLADLINSKIKAFKEKAKKIFVDNFMKKINLFFKNNPKLSFTVSVLFLLLKTGNILVNPISFLIQFFSGMLMKSCGAVVDKFLAVLEKNKDKEGDDLKNIITKSLLGFEIKTDETKKETKKEPEVPENSSFNYKNLVNDFEQYYYEHIKNNIVDKSLFLKENNIFYEEEKTTVTKNIDTKLIQHISPGFYKQGKVIVSLASLRKGIFKADIYTISKKIYFKVNKVIIKDEAKIKENLKTIGVSDEDLKKIKITNNYIELTQETFDILKKAFDNYVPGTKAPEVTPTEAQTGETKGEENKGEEKTGTEEAKPEEEKIKNDEASKLLNDNQKLYIPIKNDSSGEQLEIGKDMPSKDDDNILGYIELDKQGVNKNNYRFSGKISIKKVFDYSTNKLTSLLFEEPEIQQKEFLNITKEPALISIRVENGKYIINSGKFLGMFGEKSKKGKVNETFFDYIRFGIKKIKEDYLKKNSLEINKLNQTERGELDKKINDILFNFDKTDNFTNIKLDALKERKSRDLETIKFSSLKTEEKIGKENLLTLKEIYININDEKTQINVADLPLVAEKPVDGIGYVKFIKIKDAKYNAYFFSKKAFNYEKNNFLKTIFEEETPETETPKNDFIDLTGEPAEVEIKLENDKFALSQKGGFLGFNKKIDKIGKVNTNYKEYIKNIIPEIEKDLVKNLIDKNETSVQDKIKDISDIELTDAGIKAAKDKKIEEIKKESQDKTNDEVEKEAEQKNMPFISKRNTLTLGLFSAISIMAVAFHASGGVLNPKVAALIAIMKTREGAEDLLKKPENFSDAMNSIDTEETLNKISDNVAGNTEVEVTTNPDELQKDLTNDSLKNTQSALENNTQQSASTAMGDEDSGVGGGGGQSEEGVGGVSTKLNIDKKQVFDNLSEKGIVKKSEVFKKIKESWIASHENSEIKSIDDIKPGSELYKKLENFTDKVIGSVDSIKDKPDGFYTKTPTLVSAINSDPDSAINIIQDKLNASIEKGWTANQIAKIDGSVTVPENNSPIPKEVIENTPKPINPILVIDPPKDPSSITEPIPKVDEEMVQPSKPATIKTPDTGDETVKPKNVNLDVEPEKPNVPPSTGDNLTPDQKVTPEPGAPEPEKPNVDQKTPETNVKEPEKPVENKNIPKNLVQAQTDAIYSVNEISDEKVLNDLKTQFGGKEPNIKLIASLLKIDEETAKNIVNNAGSKESILKNIESRLKELSAPNSAPNAQETVSDAAQNSNAKKEAIKSAVSDNSAARAAEYLQKYTNIVEQLKNPEFKNETLKELRDFIKTGDITNNTGKEIIFKSPIDGTQTTNTLKGFGIDGNGLYTIEDYGFENMRKVWNYFAREGKLNWTPIMFKLILEDKDKMQEILNAINEKYPLPTPETINQSYQYMSKDEKFLFNEYFKLESKLNRWKK